MIKFNEQKRTDKLWVDEAGNKVPVSNITPLEKKLEKMSASIAMKAGRINEMLIAFKRYVNDATEQAFDEYIKQYEGKRKAFKGNFTFFNFERTVKVCINTSCPIKFDEAILALAKNEFDDLLSDSISSSNEFVREMVMDAFESSGGNLDTKKVLGLRRYADRISDSRFTKAMELIDKAIRRPSSKKYFRVWVKNSNNEWQLINLDFAAIKEF